MYEWFWVPSMLFGAVVCVKSACFLCYSGAASTALTVTAQFKSSYKGFSISAATEKVNLIFKIIPLLGFSVLST